MFIGWKWRLVGSGGLRYPMHVGRVRKAAGELAGEEDRRRQDGSYIEITFVLL